MNWPTYGEYKDSGIEWAGQVPAAWQIAEIKHSHEVTLGKMLQSSPNSDSDTSMPYLRAAHIQPSGLSFEASDQSMWFSPREAIAHDLQVGDVVVVEGGAGYGRSATLRTTLMGWGFQNSINRLRPRSGTWGRYSDFCLQSALTSAYIEVTCGVATIPHLTAEKLGQLRIPRPTFEEQLEIADFLDRETAKIDALIAKQEQLIATLREDRAATITQAVTKGLDPAVEMKVSGVEWIAEIPAHWTHSRVGYASKMLTGFPFKSEGFTDDPKDLPLLRGINVGVGRMNWESVVYWPESSSSEMSAYRLLVGDIVIGLDRPFIGAGTRVARVGVRDVPSLLLQRVLRLRAMPSFDQGYLAYLISGQGFVDHLTPIFTGVSVPHVSPEQVASFRIPEPTRNEQEQIVSFLDERCTKIDTLIGKSTDMIETLREYRSTLITDAVTGKIDVRGVE